MPPPLLQSPRLPSALRPSPPSPKPSAAAPAQPARAERRSAPSPTISSIARSAPAASFARVRAISRRRSRLPRRAAWFRPSRALRSPTRRACSISTTASANGRWAIRASRTSTSAAMLRTRASPIASSIAESPTRRSFRAATAARRRRCRSADRASARLSALGFRRPAGRSPLAALQEFVDKTGEALPILFLRQQDVIIAVDRDELDPEFPRHLLAAGEWYGIVTERVHQQ